MALCDFRASHRTKTSYAKSATTHALYLTREGQYAPGWRPSPGVSEAEYVTRSERYAMGKEDLVAKGWTLPDWAAGNPATFWAAADRYERQSGRVCESWILSLPRELSQRQNIALAQEIVAVTMGTRYAHTWAMHEVTASDGARQPHLHLMFSGRVMDAIDRSPAQFFRRYNAEHPAQGGAQKDPVLHLRSYLTSQRQLYSDIVNVHLEQAGVEARMDPRALRDRGFGGRKTELHLGPERHAVPTEKTESRREIVAAENMARREARQAQKPEEAAHAQRYWTARKQELGLTPAMDHGARIQRISEASEVHRRTQEAERQILMRGREAMTEEEAQARLQRHQAQTMELRALRQAEEHYSKHSQELRTPSHLAAIAKVLHDDDQEHGRVRRRGRSREDEQDRTRTHVREW